MFDYADSKQPDYEHKVIDNTVYDRVLLYRTSVDMDTFALDRTGANPADVALVNWEVSEQGQWCKDRCKDIRVIREPDHTTFMYKIAIIGMMKPPDVTYFRLKWPVQN